MQESAGLHVILDGYVVDSDVFEKENLIETFQELVKVLDMKILLGPEFLEVPVDPSVLKRVKETGRFQDEGGITGFCIISTSHISIHCWPLQNFFSMDVFSCREFNDLSAVDVVKERLGARNINISIVARKKPAN